MDQFRFLYSLLAKRKILVTGILCLLSVPDGALQATPPVHTGPDTPLIEAVRDGDKNAIMTELLNSAHISGRDRYGTPVLIVALQFGHDDIARFLIEKGAKIDAKSADGDTALCYSIRKKKNDMVSLLLEKKATPDRLCAGRETPLLLAVRGNNLEGVNLLLEYHADIEATDLTGRNALAIAREKRNKKITERLEAAGLE